MNAMTRTLIGAAISSAFAGAWANPTGPAVVSGSALVSTPSPSVMQIVNTPGTIINWQGFSIANGETTRFVQLNAASAVLNRVVSGNPSAILGRLESNGRVFLVNPNGIVFGGGSVVDVAGLIASTRDITDANFLAGNYLFNGFANAGITVQNGAQILTSTYGPGGQVWLFAKNVTQEAGSTITTPQGQTVLAAGTELQVATNGLGQMSFAVVTDGTNTVDSLGTIAADRGAVGVFADFINHRGTVNAGSQGGVAMDATKELRIQGASQINAPDGSVTVRGGSVLEVEYDSIINADGANGRISFESNNLLVSPSGNTHAVGGQVIFNQYQPTQYTPGAAQQLWATPAGYIDRDTLVYRRSDGNNVVRFTRVGSLTASPFVEPFEVVLDGRTGAVISGPTSMAALSGAAALVTNGAGAVAFRSVYLAASPPVFNSDRFVIGNPNTGVGVMPSTSIPTGDGGSLAHNGSTPGLNLLSSAGTLVQDVGSQYYIVPMSDGTLITRSNNGLGYDVLSLAGATLRSVIEPVAFGVPGDTFVVVPNQLGGLSVIQLAFSSHIEYDLTKTVAAYTPTNQSIGVVGSAAAFATAPGVATGPGAVASPTPTVVRGRPGGGSIFDGIAGCDFSCGERAREASAAVDALRIAQANAAMQARAAETEIQAALRAREDLAAAQEQLAEAERTMREDIEASREQLGSAVVDAQLAAMRLANPATPGSRINDQDAATAVRALARVGLSSDEMRFLELQQAAGRQMGGRAANAAALFMQDNNELRQLVEGVGNLGAMSPEGKYRVFLNWMDQLESSQRQGNGNPGEISVLSVAQNLTTRDQINIFVDTVVNSFRGLIP